MEGKDGRPVPECIFIRGWKICEHHTSPSQALAGQTGPIEVFEYKLTRRLSVSRPPAVTVVEIKEDSSSKSRASE